MKFFSALLLIGSFHAAASECTFSKVVVEESAKHYRSSLVEEDPTQALIKNGFIHDVTSPNIAYLSQSKTREQVHSAINPLTLGYEVFSNVVHYDSPFKRGWINAGSFVKKTKIKVVDQNEIVVGVLSSKKVMVSDGVQENFKKMPKFEVVKKDCSNI